MDGNESKATGRPWGVEREPIGTWDIHGADVDEMVAECEMEADARLIVDRVNGWDALLAERDAARAECARYREALNSAQVNMEFSANRAARAGLMDLSADLSGYARAALGGKGGAA